jgi:hypothetical protein
VRLTPPGNEQRILAFRARLAGAVAGHRAAGVDHHLASGAHGEVRLRLLWYLTLDNQAGSGSYKVCPVCFWEDDPAQFDAGLRSWSEQAEPESGTRKLRGVRRLR